LMLRATLTQVPQFERLGKFFSQGKE